MKLMCITRNPEKKSLRCSAAPIIFTVLMCMKKVILIFNTQRHIK